MASAAQLRVKPLGRAIGRARHELHARCLTSGAFDDARGAVRPAPTAARCERLDGGRRRSASIRARRLLPQLAGLLAVRSWTWLPYTTKSGRRFDAERRLCRRNHTPSLP